MIRQYLPSEIDAVLNIWLEASIKAHDFVPSTFWESQLENMRETYLPASDVYVYARGNDLLGFYALYENMLAAIFVTPKWQGCGIGKQLLEHAKAQRKALTLSVYKENVASYHFYLSQGFTLIKEQTDEHTGHQEYVMIYNAD